MKLKFKGKRITHEESKSLVNSLLKKRQVFLYLHILNGKSFVSEQRQCTKEYMQWVFQYCVDWDNNIDFKFSENTNEQKGANPIRVMSLDGSLLLSHIEYYENKEISKLELYEYFYSILNAFISFADKESLKRNIVLKIKKDLKLKESNDILKFSIKDPTDFNQESIDFIVGNYFEKENLNLPILKEELKELKINTPYYSDTILNYMRSLNSEIYRNFKGYRKVINNQNKLKFVNYPNLYTTTNGYWEFNEIKNKTTILYQDTLTTEIPKNQKEYKELISTLKKIISIVK